MSVIVKSQEITIKKVDYNLEALRGFAAVIVVWFHVILHKNLLDPAFQPSGIWAYLPPGHQAVLVFFLLSGYVIELSTKQVALTSASIPEYLKKRLVRIYPIYALSMLLTLLVAVHHYSFSTITNHFTLTQILFSPLIEENNPVWSLHYEVLFYLLFIPLSYFRLSPLLMGLGALVVGIATVRFYSTLHLPPLLSSYSVGFAFWLSGVALARYVKQQVKKVPYALMLSMLLLLLAVQRFNLLDTVCRVLVTKLGFSLTFPDSVTWPEKIIPVVDLAYLPFCIGMLLIFSGKKFWLRRLIIAFLLLSPLYTFRYLYTQWGAYDVNEWVLPTVFYVAALVIYLLAKRLNSLARPIIYLLSRTGTISYGLYIIHFPLLYGFSQIPFFSGSPYTFITRAMLYLGVCLTLAYLLEKKFQPRVRVLLMK
ncbi:acyltransferase family protein [Hymenobacter jejuensis]|uniref:Acyltransferase n=1 Tax=Hymenobacter jejuensis TaxID=2502781 RepID=A0A5B7ZVM8_9BACT|nr:acyltransferase [Hymenobacter jejuensis]QDA58917.1 acyltransferase [Hymenobacter jejuensis]